jgi:acyl-CoA thioesterase FadM
MPPFVHRQEVRFPDVDHAGIAFFGALQVYCHYAHEEWLKMAIEVSLGRLGQRAMTLVYHLQNQTTQRLVGVTRITQVCAIMREMRSVPIPDDFRQAVARWAELE